MWALNFFLKILFAPAAVCHYLKPLTLHPSQRFTTEYVLKEKDSEKLIGTETYIHFDAFQKVAVFRRVCAGHVAVEFLVTPVPLDCVQLILLQVVVTVEPDHVARRNCLWYSDLHSAQPAGTCKQQSADVNWLQRKSD